MSEQTPKEPIPAEDRSLVDQAADLARTTFSVVKTIVFITPLVLVVLIVALSLMGPAIGNVFSNVVNSL